MTKMGRKMMALVLTLSPAIAFAHPIQNVSLHERPVIFHDHGPKPHQQGSVAHH